jgi:hypothetical protein
MEYLSSSLFVLLQISFSFICLWLLFQLESICEDRVVTERKQNLLTDFFPTLRSGEWSDIGGRPYMEDTHICISDLAKKFGSNLLISEHAISFYGVSYCPICCLPAILAANEFYVFLLFWSLSSIIFLIVLSVR